jgi:hypothetical protein
MDNKTLKIMINFLIAIKATPKPRNDRQNLPAQTHIKAQWGEKKSRLIEPGDNQKLFT